MRTRTRALLAAGLISLISTVGNASAATQGTLARIEDNFPYKVVSHLDPAPGVLDLAQLVYAQTPHEGVTYATDRKGKSVIATITVDSTQYTVRVDDEKRTDALTISFNQDAQGDPKLSTFIDTGLNGYADKVVQDGQIVHESTKDAESNNRFKLGSVATYHANFRHAVERLLGFYNGTTNPPAQ